MLSFPYYLIAEWMCFIISILLLKNSDFKFGLIIKLYLFSVVLVESFCYFFVHDNNGIYNLDSPVEFVFGIWILSKIINSNNLKLTSFFCYIIYFISYLLEWLNQRGFHSFFYLTCTMGSVIMIGLCILYYYMLFHEEKYINLLTDPAFWLVSGYFIFYTTNVGFAAYFHQLVNIQNTDNEYLLGTIIMDVLNLILYGFWIISFVCMRKKRRYIPLL